MTPEQTTLIEGLKAPLLTIEDGERFLASESALREAMKAAEATLTVVEHTNAQARINIQTMQAAWLHIEQAFAVDPELGSVVLSRDEEEGDNGFVYVQMGVKGEPDQYSMGEYPGGADEQLQMFINDMGGNTFLEFHNDLVALGTIEHDDLDACATVILGDAWNTARRATALNQALPVSSPNALKPRF